MDLHGAGDGADRSRANPIIADGLDGRFAQLGVIAEAKVVVGGEIDDQPSVVGADRGLRIVKHAQAEVRAFLLQLVELGGKVLELGARGERSGHGVPRRVVGRN